MQFSPLPSLRKRGRSYLAEALQSFSTWTERPTHRAFALGRTGAWGAAYGHRSLTQARNAARSNCETYGDGCVVIAEDEEVVWEENPFPTSSDEIPFLAPTQRPRAQTVLLLSLAALGLLLLGTIAAERYPLFLFDTWLSDIWKLRMNDTLLPFGFLYFVLMLPLFSRLRQRDFTNPLTWFVFGAPILPYVVSVLYLRQKRKLSEQFELE